jgi:predicted metal-dependent hydrolase
MSAAQTGGQSAWVVYPTAADWGAALSALLRPPFVARAYADTRDLVGRLAADHAAAVLVDGVSTSADEACRTWVLPIKTSPATRRIPVAVVLRAGDPPTAYQRAGADVLIPHDALAHGVALVLAAARLVQDDVALALQQACDQALLPEAVEAITLFNRGEYYAQHDALEALWVSEANPVRDLYRAILQVGVGYYQVTRGNRRGALKMLLRAQQWLHILPPRCRGVDVAQLRADADAVLAALNATDDDALTHFDRALLRPVQYIRE